MNLDQMASVLDAIIVDEVGIESGGYGRYRLRSSCQPIFERTGDVLRPVAVEGLVSPYVAGQPAPSADLFAAPQDRRFIERMGWILQLRNHRNIGVDDLQLYVDFDSLAGSDPDTLTTEIWFIAEQLADIGLDPRQLVCMVGETVARDPAVLSQLVAEMRSQDFNVAIGDFGAGHWTEEQADLLRPDIFRIEGAWFRKICREPTTVRLFEAVVARLRERAAKVLVAGIEDQAQFGVALRAGADFFQGPHLAETALVGTFFNETPLSVAEKLGEASKIVPMRLKHQPR